ncbi:Gfo/Idh/MocA family protein [Paenibacillus sacheonensis]|uniref:Gfo/Idh/MocA family oxidoreductase n=1 Tax=Paenibacillus sacheonensis TaxID=742054 RepID=A0A7X5BWF4_9BACL|nr:Gfo/Idh/MocA family oxidoreductase [Paenibacillus sacheonensis]MBM7564220.1 putative dehydrogenase [Paenibacillus sacheonensis]NBC67457.1 Gfo/Idh/MocA family oxidoreductase [Paenibacillus sacheonensis]
MSKVIKLGLIGLGEAAQVIHLPVLQAMGDIFEIVAVCDISPTLVQVIGEQYRVDGRYTSAEDLLDDEAVEAVLVLNSDEYHADCIVGALERGKHAFVEKPMCLTKTDANRIIAAKNASAGKLMVGYMRRYAPAFVEAVEEVKKLGRINYARVRDIIGQNGYFIQQTANVLRFADIPAELAEDRRLRGQAIAKEALGDKAERFNGTYRLMGGLSSHDLSAMREILGMPARVLAASRWNGGQFMSAMFQYDDGFHVLFETGVDHQGRFDAFIEVMGETGTVRVDYDTAYIRHLPTMLTVTKTTGDRHVETVTRPTFTDSYTIELRHFHDVIVNDAPIKTTPEDAAQDLELFDMLIEAMDESEQRVSRAQTVS